MRLSEAANWYRGETHQLAAWNWLQEQLSAEAQKQFAEMYRAGPAKPKAPEWLAPALTLIKEFEGLRLESYQCPAGVWTVGWGATRINGRPVQKGDRVTYAQAEELLRAQLQEFAEGVFALLPGAKNWGAGETAALVSFAFNVGLGALKESLLRKRILQGEDRHKVVREELPKWVTADGKRLEGLVRRRNAEVALFCPPKPPVLHATERALRVPYFSQRDSRVLGQADRMCFSSSCSMLLAYLRPGAINGANADDLYLITLRQYGDTTDPQAQLKTLASYGVKARFIKNASWATIEQQINRGVPVPCGFLHHGPSSAPSGGGHWLCIRGYTPEHMIVNDPWGEMDVLNGRYIHNNGENLRYSRRHWGPRWMVEGAGTGWAIVAEP